MKNELSKKSKLLKGFTLLLMILFFATTAMAQLVSVSGRVVDKESKLTLPGVTVLLRGKTQGTVTDMDGKFLIQASSADQLVFSYIGYVSQTISLEGRTSIEVMLAEAVKGLDEVVVIGYGTQKKSDLTGSVASISSETIKDLPVLGVDQAMQGRAAGVMVSQNSGSPGSGIMVRIRGIGTTGSPDPLYVVDGIAVGNISFLNPSDIHSIEILKDAAAAAIYGASAANGVVLITTKQGKSGKITVEFSGYYGLQTLAKKYDVTAAPREVAQPHRVYPRRCERSMGGEQSLAFVVEMDHSHFCWLASVGVGLGVINQTILKILKHKQYA